LRALPMREGPPVRRAAGIVPLFLLGVLTQRSRPRTVLAG